MSGHKMDKSRSRYGREQEYRLEVEVERGCLLGPRSWRWYVIQCSPRYNALAQPSLDLPERMVVAAGWGWTAQQTEHRGRRAARNIRAVRQAAADSTKRV